MYSQEQRKLQSDFGTEKLADKLVNMIVKSTLEERDRAFLESREMFFLSTVDKEGRPTVSFKGGAAGFLKAIDEKTVVFPSYDGNGMFLSMGNISATNQVGLLLIDFETPHRMRIQGKAMVNQSDPLLEEFPGANLIVRVEIEKTWINCPRYIPTYRKIASSKYIPRTDGRAPIAAWKKIEELKEVLTPSDRKMVESSGETLTMEEYAKKVSDGEA